MKQEDKMLSAIASGDVEKIEDQLKQAEGSKIVIGGFLDHYIATTSGQLDNPNIEVEFADTPYTRFIIDLAKKENAQTND